MQIQRETATLAQSFIRSMFILITQGTGVDCETKPEEVEISPKGFTGKVQTNNKKKIPPYVS